MRLIFVLLLLAGCSENTPVAVPVPVQMPVAISCDAEPIAEPDWNIPHLAQDAGVTDKLKAALADLDLSKGYINELQAELTACT